MTDISINLFDIGVLTIVSLSALLSFYRGFVSEIVSLGSWLLASFVALRFLEPATNMLKPHIDSEPVAAGVAAIFLFFTTMIVFSIAAGSLVKMMKLSAKVGRLDNLVGLCFGVARGALIVAIGYFIMSKFFTDEKNYPELVRHAATRQYVEESAKWIANVTPDYLDKVISENKSDAANGSRDIGKKSEPGAVSNLIKSIEKKPNPLLEQNLRLNGVGDGADVTMPSMDDLQKRIHEENENK